MPLTSVSQPRTPGILMVLLPYYFPGRVLCQTVPGSPRRPSLTNPPYISRVPLLCSGSPPGRIRSSLCAPCALCVRLRVHRIYREMPPSHTMRPLLCLFFYLLVERPLLCCDLPALPGRRYAALTRNAFVALLLQMVPTLLCRVACLLDFLFLVFRLLG